MTSAKVSNNWEQTLKQLRVCVLLVVAYNNNGCWLFAVGSWIKIAMVVGCLLLIVGYNDNGCWLFVGYNNNGCWLQ